MNSAKINQAIVELMRFVASERNGALWSGHSGVYLLHRTILASWLETHVRAPVMFETFAGLEQFAQSEGLDIVNLPLVARADAVELISTPATAQLYKAGIGFVWVRANWKNYRTAMLAHIAKHSIGASSLSRHDEAANLFEELRGKLKSGALRQNISRSDRTELLYIFAKEISAHRVAATKGGDELLFARLNATLDADHVINKSSLTKLPDSWVMLFPVPADSNRGFGRHIERSVPKAAVGIGQMDLAPKPLVAFKLFANFMPKTRTEFAKAMKTVRKQMGPNGELDQFLDDMEVEFLRATRI